MVEMLGAMQELMGEKAPESAASSSVCSHLEANGSIGREPVIGEKAMGLLAVLFAVLG